MEYLTLAYVLIALGLVLLLAELFIPSMGLLTVLGLAAVIGGVVLTYLYGDPALFLVTVVGVFIALPAVFVFGMYYWPRTPLGRRLFVLPTEEDAEKGQRAEAERLRGRIGKALSPLRPAGVVDFDGRRVDVLAEGNLVEAGQWVKCIEVRAGRVIVRPVPGPSLGDLENAELSG
jgi:membrane-bound serine protease (ClpP class)